MQLIQKMQLKKARTLNILNAPSVIKDTLPQEFPGIEVVFDAENPSDAVLLFVTSLAGTLELFPQAALLVGLEGLLWLAYPKLTSKVPSDLNRDIIWKGLEDTGWRPVRMVSLDDTWSLMRFRPVDKVNRS